MRELSLCLLVGFALVGASRLREEPPNALDLTAEEITWASKEHEAIASGKITGDDISMMRRICKGAGKSAHAQIRGAQAKGIWETGQGQAIANQTYLCDDAVHALNLHRKEKEAADEVAQLEAELRSLKEKDATVDANVPDPAAQDS